jgi:predicted permease
MIVGVISRKTKILNKEINRGLSELLINVTLPLLIVSSFNMEYESEMMTRGKMILVYSIIIHISLIFVGNLFFVKFDKNKKNVLKFITVFSNVGFMGYPILDSIYGQTGVFYAAIFNIPFNILVWTVGVMFFTGEKDIKAMKKVLVNPAFIAVILGLIIFRFSIKLPAPVLSTFQMVGSITTPISMIIIGSMLADSKIKDIFADFSIYYGAIIRLIVIPALIYVVLRVLNADEMLMKICVILQAMPAAVTTAIIAEKYGGDAVYASQSVFITTILSVISFPIVIILLGI